MKMLLARAGVFALLFTFCAFVVATMVAVYRNVDDDDTPVMLQESLMVATSDGRTIECLVFNNGSISCNWNLPVAK